MGPYAMGRHQGQMDYRQAGSEVNLNIWPQACSYAGASSIRPLTTQQRKTAEQWQRGYLSAIPAAVLADWRLV